MKKIYYLLVLMIFLGTNTSIFGQTCPVPTSTVITSCGNNNYTLHLCWSSSGNTQKRIEVYYPNCLDLCINATHSGCEDINFYSSIYPSGVQLRSFSVNNCNGTPCQIKILPVILVKTFAASRSNSTVTLRWETAMEQMNLGFDIERKIDGDWKKIAFVPSLAVGGNSDIILNYQYIDLNNTNSISQYRLRQMDVSQYQSISNIVVVRGVSSGVGGVLVYPNPNLGLLNIVFKDNNPKDILLSDISGKVVWQQTNVTDTYLSVSLNLLPGMYILKTTGENSIEVVFH